MLLIVKAAIDSIIMNMVWVFCFKKKEMFIVFMAANIVYMLVIKWFNSRTYAKKLVERDNCHILKFLEHQIFIVKNHHWYEGNTSKAIKLVDLAIGLTYNGEAARALRILDENYRRNIDKLPSDKVNCFNTEKLILTAYIMANVSENIIYGHLASLTVLSNKEGLSDEIKDYMQTESDIEIAKVAAIFNKSSKANTKLYEAFKYHTKPIDKVQDAYWYLVGTSEGELSTEEIENRGQLKNYVLEFGFDTIFSRVVKLKQLDRKDEEQ